MFFNPQREIGDWIDQEGCEDCDETGLYAGLGEPEGTANICWGCSGKGHVPAGNGRSNGKPFAGRRIRTDIKFVRVLTGIEIGKPKVSKLITYDQFLNGKLPRE